MDESEALIEYVRTHSAAGEFKPCAFYGDEEDALVFYFRNDPDYAKRINRRVTLYLSMETNELVGCQIKEVRSVLEDIGAFDIKIKHGKVKLSLILLPFLGTVLDDPNARQLYRELGRAASEYDPEVSLPELV
jgi:hypothetical protein